MSGDVREVQVFRAQELDGRAFEQGVVLLADVSSVLDRFVADVMDVLQTQAQRPPGVNQCGRGELTALVQMIPT